MSQIEQPILAAYYNDARLNILACLNDIREKNGKKRMANDDQIRAAYRSLALTQSTPEHQRDLIKQLRRRFIFIDVLTESFTSKTNETVTPSPQRYDATLNWMFALINDLRNSLVHPCDPGVQIEQKVHKHLFHALNKVYDASLREVKKRFQHETKTVNPLSRCDGRGQPKKASKFSFALITNPKSVQQKQSQPYTEIFHDFGHILFCSLFLDKNQSADLLTHYWKMNHNQHWATPQQAIINELVSVYRVRLPLQRLRSDNTETSVTLDTLSELSRCPRILLETLSPSDQAHFRSSPSFTPENRNNANNKPDPTYLYARSHQSRFVPLMMRFLEFDPDNRLRFAIDLGHYYFNVRKKPGNHFTDGRSRVRRIGQKLIAYGHLSQFENEDVPSLWQQLQANRAEATQQEEIINTTPPKDIEALKPYIVPCHPHYHFYDDKIGFRLAEEGKASAPYPKLTVSDASKACVYKPIVGKTMEPEFWISPSQLQHLVFYSYLQKREGRQPKLANLLQRYRSGMKQLLIELENGTQPLSAPARSPERRKEAQAWIDQLFKIDKTQSFSVALADLPKVIGQHLSGAVQKQTSPKEITARINSLLEETEKKQRQIEDLIKGFKKPGQKGFRPIKCGHIGDFLTDDLMRFQPIDSSKDDGGKLNSQQYQILQAALAYYGAHIDEPPKIVDLLQDAGLLTGPYAHPFLGQLGLGKQANRYSGLISFYQAYLNARKQFLNAELKRYQSANTAGPVPRWLRLKQNSSLQAWLDEHKKTNGQPLPIPKAMLYQPILALVAKDIGISAEALSQEGSRRLQQNGKEITIRPAVSWLIRRYLQHQNDSAQAMYQYRRNHRLFDSYLDNRTKKFDEKKRHHLTESQRQSHLATLRAHIQSHGPTEKTEKLSKQLKAYKQQEKRIRHIVTQDMLLYLFAQQYLNKLQLSHPEAPPIWRLKQVDRTLLETTIHYELAVPTSQKTLYHPECKIKNIGELRLLVRAQQLPTLLSYYPHQEQALNQAEIRAELNSYRRERVKVMKMVHRLEREIIQYCGPVSKRETSPDTKASTKSFGQGRHGDFLYTLQQHFAKAYAQAPTQWADYAASFDLSHFNQTRLIRNSFSHNKYPDAEIFAKIAQRVQAEAIPDNPAQHRHVAKRLQQEIERLYKPWRNYLKAQTRSPQICSYPA